jgi:hypothetical protein
MMQGDCAYCRGAVCAFCGDCHTRGCVASYERCDREVLAMIGELARALGYVVKLDAGMIRLCRGPSEYAFSSSSEGLREVEHWLDAALSYRRLEQMGRMVRPKSSGNFWQRVREVFGRG